MNIRLTEFELRVCGLSLNGREIIGFHKPLEELIVTEPDKFKKHLVEQGILEPREKALRFSTYFQGIIRQLANPDFVILARNDVLHMIRRIYVRDVYYLCVDDFGNGLDLFFLPSIELVIGAFAEAFGEWEDDRGREAKNIQSKNIESEILLFEAYGLSCMDRVTEKELWILAERGKDGIQVKSVLEGEEEIIRDSVTVIQTMVKWILGQLKRWGERQGGRGVCKE